MDTISPFGEDADEDEDEVDGQDAVVASAAEVSHEFIRYHNAGAEPSCWAPWRMLKIDIRSRTAVCCSFAHKLPKFDWPTARTFHDETGMWNHPYMQHMRQTMGKANELPFCTVCRTTDKRDFKNRDARREAMRATQKIYSGFLDRIAADSAKGAVDRYALKPATFATKLTAKVDASVMRSVVRGRSQIRAMLRHRAFDSCRRVLQIGTLNGTITPYFAEFAEHVTVVGDRPTALERVRDVATILGFDNIAARSVESLADLPFEDGAFDGIWVNGSSFSLIGRSVMLAEIKRLLAPGGRFSAVQCLAPGGLIERVVDGRIARGDAVAALTAGVPYGGRGSFMTSITVLAALKGSGFVSDRTCPPAGLRFPGDTGEPTLRTDYAELAHFLDPCNRQAGFFGKTGPLQGVERFVSFTAVRELPNHHHA